MTLFQIDSKLYELLGRIAENVDEETGEVKDTGVFEEYEAYTLAREEKIEGTALYIKELGYEADALASEIKNLQARKKACENKQENLKRYLAISLAGEKFKSAKVAVSYRKSEAIEIACDVEQLPAEFQKIETKISADKTALKSFIKEGNAVDGVELVTKNNIQIK